MDLKCVLMNLERLAVLSGLVSTIFKDLTVSIIKDSILRSLKTGKILLKTGDLQY